MKQQQQRQRCHHPIPIRSRNGFVLIWVFLCTGLVAGILATALIAVFYERKAILHQQEVLRAEAAVQAALAAAQALLCGAVNQYPDAASVWEEHLPGIGTPGTALHILKREDFSQPARALVLPLVSGIYKARELAQSHFETPPELCDFTRFSPKNWIGEEGISMCAPWVQLFPEKVGNLPKEESIAFLARYAFILEDESFKLNIQQASLRDRTPLQSAKDISLQAILSQLPDLVSPEAEIARDLFALRERLGGFCNLRQSHSVLRLTPTQWDHWKYLCTVYSEALNCTRSGVPRINLNKLFVPTSSTEKIRQQLDIFISAVRRESPYFGQRFYRQRLNALAENLNNPRMVTQKHEEIYLNKLAANVRDFLLSEDPHPTRVLATTGYPVLPFSQLEMPKPEGGFGPNPLVAIGKKRIPYLQEYALVTRLVNMEPAIKVDKNSDGAKFEMTLDHFLEFWNLNDKPIRVEDLGAGAKLILRNQPEWKLDAEEGEKGGRQKGRGIPPGSERNIEILLKDFKSLQGDTLVFQPGKATVLTTYPEQPPLHLFPKGAQFFIASGFDPQKRKFSGITYRTKTEHGIKKYEVATKLRNEGGMTDHETEYLLINDQGWVDGFNYLSIMSSIAMRGDDQTLREEGWHIRSSGLQGENEKEKRTDQMGDPRTLNEQLILGEYTTTQGKNRAMNDAIALLKSPLPRTRFLRNATTWPGKSSWGSVHSPFMHPEKWGDPIFSEFGNTDLAPTVFPEGPLKTIGELGHVFDPIKDSTSQIERDRGGGRTLRIGQPEFYSSHKKNGIWDRDPLSPSREWTAWRLCDIFSVTDHFRLPGAVNINGILRSEGAILKSLLYDFRWESHATSSRELGGSRLEREDIQLVISHFQKRLRSEFPYQNRGGPFFERGEISEIDLFQSSHPFPITFTNQSQVGLGQRNDRVREEIVRHILEAITTRGNIFTAYCVGQAVSRTPDGQLRIRATRKAKFTFRLVPCDTTDKRRVDVLLPHNKKVTSPFRYGIELLARED